MSQKRSEKIAILKGALAKISQNQKNIKLTKEDIEKANERFINYTNLNVEFEKVREDLANLIIDQHDNYALEPESPY
jgi:uncharacterized protein YpuA (DUF1002 family)